MKEGFIYFIASEGYGAIKIGWSRMHPRQRLAQLQTGCPDYLYIVAYIRGTQEDERRLHQTFDWLRIRGEWFVWECKLKDFLGYLDAEDNENTPASQEAFEVALLDCVEGSNWQPDHTLSEKSYDASGDFGPWRHYFDGGHA